MIESIIIGLIVLIVIGLVLAVIAWALGLLADACGAPPFVKLVIRVIAVLIFLIPLVHFLLSLTGVVGHPF